MAELHETLMGRKLIQHDIPEIAKQLSRIADALDCMLETIDFYVDSAPKEEIKVNKEEENIEYLKSIRINDLDLSVRCINALQDGIHYFFEEFTDKYYRKNIITLYHLILIQEEDIMKLRNFGLKSFTELKESLECFNLYLGIEKTDIGKLEIKKPILPLKK
jgi:DNA-directed RNA polymerase alpha subunit